MPQRRNVESAGIGPKYISIFFPIDCSIARLRRRWRTPAWRNMGEKNLCQFVEKWLSIKSASFAPSFRSVLREGPNMGFVSVDSNLPLMIIVTMKRITSTKASTRVAYGGYRIGVAV